MSAPISPPTSFSCPNCGCGWNYPTRLCPHCGQAQTRSQTQKPICTSGRSWVSLGLAIGLLSNGVVLVLSFVFYLSAAALPPGTSIRPMGLGFVYFSLGLLSGAVGVPLSLLGASHCKKAGDSKGANLGANGAGFSILPLPLALSLFYLIISLCGLSLAD